ncbi:MAG TPA: acetylxylan esterase [Acidobacteriota bacterium]|jgi:cephalosporin-C deacetylase-like acetyl esterase
MRLRTALIAFLALVLATALSAAQKSDELDFLSDLEEFRLLRNMLPDYVHQLAKGLLAERERKIAGLSTPQQVAERRAYIREKILQALGGLPDRTPLNARVVGVLERDNYKIEKVIFESQPRFYVTGNLYLPKNGRGPYPGILFPLGHELGGKTNETWQQMLGSLATKGYVAFTWDPIGQGERVQLYDPDFDDSKVFRSTTEHTIIGIQCQLAGDNLARYTIWDGMRALDYLMSRPEVDTTRIGCTGNSGGGTHTAYLSALDDRIKIAAPSCYLTSWRRLLESIGPQDAEQVLLPFLDDGLDQADFVHAFAPKPYLILSAIRDFFSISGARETYAEAKRIYALLGEQEKLSMFEADDHHGYTKPRRMAAYRWFSRWFKGTDDREPEPEIDFATEEELRCTESGQVATSLGGETVFSLNEKRVEQLGQKKPPMSNSQYLTAYRDEIRQQVRRLIDFKLLKGPVTVKSYGEIQRPGYHIEKLTYESEPGIIVPALLFLPDPANARRPAIVYVHGKGKAAEASSGGDIEQIAKAGFIVLAIDTRGSGETRFKDTQQANDFPRYFGDYDSAKTALLVGKPLVGMRALDVCRGVDLLVGRAEVDREKIYGFGKEAGAVPLLYAAIFDERLKKVALDDMLISYRSIITHRIHRQIFENVVPGALRFYDFPDLVASLAPRPTWIVNAVDPLGHRVGIAEVRKEYEPSLIAFRLAEAKTSIRVSERSPHRPLAAFYEEWLKRD